ncbi:hypothetical protein SDD27957_03490 [Streptococcus dysgalactiae subsp. dysgalactiae ATCC 27957]|nr:hypothetical protein SDD27957_03490 [Streptococcus dysgalactiae subsp. dysgalactiae ATCC 27957]
MVAEAIHQVNNLFNTSIEWHINVISLLATRLPIVTVGETSVKWRC